MLSRVHKSVEHNFKFALATGPANDAADVSEHG